jgi:broad specificity phosphatase PhoE
MTLSLLATLVCVPAVASAQKLILVVRHAERADGDAAAGQMQAATDPPLSAAGQARATRLAAMLADAGITAIYATQYRRTQDTAKPLAASLGLDVRTRDARDQEALLRTLASDHADDVVLLVGHSNTVPAIVQAFGGPTFAIDEDDYTNLFVVVPSTGTVTRIRY